MTGINATLDIAKLAIAANQYGLSVTGQNIANVDNTTYSRQLVELQNGATVKIGNLVFGSGVEVSQITAAVDDLLLGQLNDQQAAASGYEETASSLTYIEDIFSLDTENSLDTLFSDFWNSWSDLSNNPTGSAERSAVLASGEAIVAQLSDMGENLTALTATTNRQIEVAVDSVNNISAQISEINIAITAIEAQEGAIANDLRDERTALVTELASLLDISTYEQDDGSLLVTTAKGSAILVGSGGARELTVSEGQVMWGGTGGIVDISDQIEGGSIGGLLDIRDEVIPEYEAELDALTKAFIWNVNSQHAQGVGLTYFDSSVTGSYGVDESGLLSTLDYATSVDTGTDLSLWIENGGVTEEVTVDLSTLMASVSSSDMTVSGTAGSVNDTYVFSVTPPTASIGGAVDVTVSWSNSQGSGSFTVAAGDTSPVEVDGIEITFSSAAGPFTDSSGTAVGTFVINTDEDGAPSENVSGYTLQDLADEINTQVAASTFGAGVTASVSADGQIVFTAASGYQFAFSDESGMAAALGVNTFFTGSGIEDIGVNEQLVDTDYIAAGQLDASGEIASGDNSNALLLSECGEISMQLGTYSFDRSSDPPSTSASVTTTTDSYYQTMVSNLGILSDSVSRNLATAEALLSEFQDERDSISGVSLDEEMINLVKYQNAYNAASKLLTVADEMLDTLISTR